MRTMGSEGRVLLALLAATLIATSLEGQDTGAEKVLIRSVRVMDRKGNVEDVVANILIRDGRLKLVTKDPIATSTCRTSLDGIAADHRSCPAHDKDSKDASS